MTEGGCPFCRNPTSARSLLGAVASLAVSCGTPVPRPSRDIAPIPSHDAQRDAAQADGPLLDAPAPKPIAVDATVVDARPVEGKGKISGRVFRKTPDGNAYPTLRLQLVGGSEAQLAATASRSKGAYEFTRLPAGTYSIHIYEGDRDANYVVNVVVGPDEAVHNDIDLARLPMRQRPAKPYGAPPARRRAV